MDTSLEDLTDPTKKYSKEVADSSVTFGSAYIAYACGVAASLVRLVVHILVPLPHRGKGLILPLCKLFTRCDGCAVLYNVDEVNEQRRAEKGIKHIEGGADIEMVQSSEIER